MLPSEDDSSKTKARHYLAQLKERLREPYAVYPPDEARRALEWSAASTSQLQNTTLDSTAGSAALEHSVAGARFPRTPDYVVDPWTQMYHLTPKGIDQVSAG